MEAVCTTYNEKNKIKHVQHVNAIWNIKQITHKYGHTIKGGLRWLEGCPVMYDKQFVDIVVS